MRRWLIILFIVLFIGTAYELSNSYALFESEADFVVNSNIGNIKIIGKNMKIIKSDDHELQINGDINEIKK